MTEFTDQLLDVLIPDAKASALDLSADDLAMIEAGLDPFTIEPMTQEQIQHVKEIQMAIAVLREELVPKATLPEDSRELHQARQDLENANVYMTAAIDALRAHDAVIQRRTHGPRKKRRADD